MSKLEIQLLGRLSIAAENVGEFALPRKNKVMLAALALAGPGGLSREKLVDLLWGDRDDKRAHASLRQALAATRKALGPYRDCLRAEPEQIRIDGAMTELDTRDFEALASSEVPGDRDRALALYQGDLLDGIRLKEEAFEAWSRPLRERLRTKAITLLSESLNSACDAERCVALASRLLELEATNEAAHRALMRTYAAQGRDNAAFKQFIVCRDLLDHELGIGPSRQTIALVEEIRGKRRLLAGRKRSGGARTAVVEPKATTVERPHSTTKPTITVPDKPSLAVLPFTNMSGDPDQEYFADGITGDIITELSRFRSLFVIARNSSFTFKGQAVDVTEVGRKLGVAYVVEGSVRKVGNRVRVTAQLVDAASGNHVWAERYDRDLEDIFAVQDELVRTITSTVGRRVDVAGQARAERLSEASLLAYDHVLRASAAWLRLNKEDNRLAREHLERAIELDPRVPRAHRLLAEVLSMDWMAHWVEDRTAALTAAFENAKRAVALDESSSEALATLGSMSLYRGEFDDAQHSFERAIKLNPNDDQALAWSGMYLTAVGRADEAVAQYDLSARINPLQHDSTDWIRGIAFFTARRYDEAITTLRAIKDQINEVRFWLAASYAGAGRLDEARAMLEEFLRVAEDDMAVFPGRKVTAWEDYSHGAMYYQDEAEFEHLYDALRKAGLED